ncbi:GIN domain-containing protein [Emticicia sp. BO119]|uniref:GIN domain-containing protein n=1 Tax=Emticicia sp. BO119 TaxID=2757768 RepID=UPI0015EFF577|nr:DUF2807 domain-containing protein [Emticicia sp. BO119]MBA4853664.1 DUF2807 domain-containing protein [Emticicia sp. BO119]
MKTSNKLLLAFLGLLISAMVFTAFQLKAEYKKINMKDKFRNADRVALKPIRFLIIQGSDRNKGDAINEFSVSCIPGNERALILPRNTFFRKYVTYSQSGDTLIIHSTLPYSYGLDIFLSGINPEKIEANAGRIYLNRLSLNQLHTSIERNAEITITNTEIKDLDVNTTDVAKVRLIKNCVVDRLDINLQKQSEIELGEVKLNKVSLKISPSAKINATKEHLLLLQKSGLLQ